MAGGSTELPRIAVLGDWGESCKVSALEGLARLAPGLSCLFGYFAGSPLKPILVMGPAP